MWSVGLLRSGFSVQTLLSSLLSVIRQESSFTIETCPRLICPEHSTVEPETNYIGEDLNTDMHHCLLQSFRVNRTSNLTATVRRLGSACIRHEHMFLFYSLLDSWVIGWLANTAWTLLLLLLPNVAQIFDWLSQLLGKREGIADDFPLHGGQLCVCVCVCGYVWLSVMDWMNVGCCRERQMLLVCACVWCVKFTGSD